MRAGAIAGPGRCRFHQPGGAVGLDRFGKVGRRQELLRWPSGRPARSPRGCAWRGSCRVQARIIRPRRDRDRRRGDDAPARLGRGRPRLRKCTSQGTPAGRFRTGGRGFARRTTGWDPGLTSTPAQAAVSRRKDRLEAVFASPSMGFVKRMCQAEAACVTTGRKSTDPAFRYRSVARFGLIDEVHRKRLRRSMPLWTSVTVTL